MQDITMKWISEKDINQLFINSFKGIEIVAAKDDKTPLQWACDTIENALRAELYIHNLFLRDGLNLSIYELVCMKTLNILSREGYETLGDVVNSSPDKLLKIKGVGRSIIHEIEDVFKLLKIKWNSY